MGRNIKAGDLTKAVMEELKAYAGLSGTAMKGAVQEAAATMRKEIKVNAPERRGTYKKSWITKKTGETADTVSMAVYSPRRYMIAHLLENGHAKRGGGRVPGIPHIAKAEEKGREQLMQELDEKLKRGST